MEPQAILSKNLSVERDTEDGELLRLRRRRLDELRKERAKEQQRFGVAGTHQKAPRKQRSGADGAKVVIGNVQA